MRNNFLTIAKKTMSGFTVFCGSLVFFAMVAWGQAKDEGVSLPRLQTNQTALSEESRLSEVCAVRKLCG